jgi:hypothetical protein
MSWINVRGWAIGKVNIADGTLPEAVELFQKSRIVARGVQGDAIFFQALDQLAPHRQAMKCDHSTF